jgi:hypothetical protein
MYYLFLPHEWTSFGPTRPAWLALFTFVVLGTWGLGTALVLDPLLAIGILLAVPGVAGLLVLGVAFGRRRARYTHRSGDAFQDFAALTLPSIEGEQRERVLSGTHQRSFIYDN